MSHRDDWYYHWQPSMSLREVGLRWVRLGQKTYENLIFYPAKVLWPYREYTWTREASRSGVGGYERFETRDEVDREGPDKWDHLYRHLAKYGWDHGNPVHLHIGKNRAAKVGEGNHRLAITMAIDPNRIVPVRPFFLQTVYKTTGYPVSVLKPTVRTPQKKPKPAVQRSIPQPREERALTDEELDERERQIAEIMRLL